MSAIVLLRLPSWVQRESNFLLLFLCENWLGDLFFLCMGRNLRKFQHLFAYFYFYYF